MGTVLGSALLVAWVVIDALVRRGRADAPEPPSWARHVPALAVLATAPVLLAALAHCAFAQPWADDYAYAVFSREHGFWSAQTRTYQAWSGRFAATALLSLPPALDLDLRTFARTTYALELVALTAGAAALVRGLGGSRRAAWVCALAFGVVVVDGLASPAESLYWAAGSLTYTAPAALLLWVFALLARSSRAAGLARHALRGVAVALAFVAAGCSEVLWVPALGALSLATAHARRSGTSWQPHAAATLALSVGVAVSALAPGNAVRRATLEGRGSVELAWRESLAALAQVGEWLQRPVLVGALVAAAPLLATLARAWRGRPLDPAAVGTCWIASLVAAWAGPAWSAGIHPPPDRALGLAWIVFVAGIVALLVTGASAWPRLATALERVPARASAAGAALVVACVWSGQGGIYVTDLRRARDLDAFFAARAEVLARTPPGATAWVRLVPAPLATVVYSSTLDLSPELDHWINKSVARWSGVGGLGVPPPGDER